MRVSHSGKERDAADFWRQLTPVVQLHFVLCGAAVATEALLPAAVGRIVPGGQILAALVQLLLRATVAPTLGLSAVLAVLQLAYFGCAVEREVFGDVLCSNGVLLPVPPELAGVPSSSSSGQRSVLVASLRMLWFCLLHVAWQLPATVLLGARPADSLVMALMFVFCRTQHPQMRLRLAIGPAVPARLFPIAMLGIHWLMGAPLLADVWAMCFGHLFLVYVVKARRDSERAAFSRRWLDVPSVVYRSVQQRHARRVEAMRHMGPLPRWR